MLNSLFHLNKVFKDDALLVEGNRSAIRELRMLGVQIENNLESSKLHLIKQLPVFQMIPNERRARVIEALEQSYMMKGTNNAKLHEEIKKGEIIK